MTTREREKATNRNNNSLWLIAIVLLMTACENVKLHSFHQINGEWSANDTLEYICDFPVQQEGLYNVDIELRTTAFYPWRELWIGMVHTGNDTTVARTDTIHCEIFNDAGRQKGTSTGVLYQTSHPAGTIHIAPGDTTRLKLFHLMDREVTGVTDVGIKIYGRHQSSGN